MTEAGTADDWADKYGRLRARGAGAPNAWLGIPLLVSALLGMLWAAPVPDALRAASPAVNIATLFLMATFVYYCILSIQLALAALVLLIAAAAPSAWLEHSGYEIWPIASAIFAPAFAWQLVETKRATGRLLILKNLQYLMLGPIWLLRSAFRKLGIAY